MKKLLVLLILSMYDGLSQPLAIDSLKRVLTVLNSSQKNSGRDSLQFQTMKKLMIGYTEVNVDSSVAYNRRLIRLCIQKRMHKDLIYAYQYAGYLFQVKGDYYQSIRYYFKALPLAEKLNRHTDIAGARRGLAHAYTSIGKYNEAAKHCLLGLAALKIQPDPYVELGILNVQGAIGREQGKFDEALETNQKMYRLAKKEGDKWYESQGLHAIGWVLAEKKDFPAALDYYQSALKLSRTIGSVDLEGSILLHIANVYMLLQDWPTALSYCNLARQKAMLVQNSSIIKETEENLYLIFKKTGKPELALRAFENFVTLRDSLAKENTDHRIELLKAQYDNVKKTSEMRRQTVKILAQENRNQQLAQTRNVLYIGLVAILIVVLLLYSNNRRLGFKNREIDRQRNLLEWARAQLADANSSLETKVAERTQELVSANQELLRKNDEIKKALFKGQTIERKRVALELHDNLSSLLSAVNMSIQAINPINLSEAEQLIYSNVRYMIQNAYSEVRNISHNILPAGFEKDGLAITLQALIDKLNQNSSLQFSATVNDLTERLPAEIEFNVYSIVLELINNAIRHAQANAVGISISRTETGIDLSVVDDGVGLGEASEKRGVGLRNIQARLDSLGGTFATMLPEKGTWILIKIPIDTVGADGNESVI